MTAEVGLSVTHRRYVKYGDAHYAGNLVDGAYVLGLFGDVATEACIRGDADEGLFASYSDVQFRAPVRAGDVIEATATVIADAQAQQAARVRGAGGLPGRARAGRVCGLGAQRAHRRGHRDRDRGGAGGPWLIHGPSAPERIGLRWKRSEGGGGHAEVQIPGPGDAQRGRR